MRNLAAWPTICNEMASVPLAAPLAAPLFADRREAGRHLAGSLAGERGAGLVVVGLARGGVVTAAAVASALAAPLDVVAVRKIGHPWQPEYGIGAVTPGDGIYLRDRDGLTDEQLAEAVERTRAKATYLDRRLHAEHEPLDLAGKTVLVVDDGLATGATMIAALRWARAAGAARVVAAVPVAPADSLARIAVEADEVVCPNVPETFLAVGFWYESFTAVGDDTVVRLIAEEFVQSSSSTLLPPPRADRERKRPHQVLAPSRRRARPVRPLPARLPPARGTARLLLRAACEGGAIVLKTYGRSSGFCVDPIEKKPLHHFLPGTAVLSFGTAGCNLACKFCQNWDISKSRENDTLADSRLADAIAEAAERLGCESVAFTYNDPVVFLEYAIDVADACRARGINPSRSPPGTSAPEPRRDLFAHVDAANIDLKGFTEGFYGRVCGGRLQTVLETLEFVAHETDVWLEVTNLVIPGHNDRDEEIDAMTRWIATRLGPDVPVHFTAFHPDYRMLDVPPTPPETLRRRARSLSKTASTSRTRATSSIRRDRARAATPATRCSSSATGTGSAPIASAGAAARTAAPRCRGRFPDSAGSWGARRLPVRIAALVAGAG